MSDYNLDREIEEGLACAERMIKRQRLVWGLGIAAALLLTAGLFFGLGYVVFSIRQGPAREVVVVVTATPIPTLGIGSTLVREQNRMVMVYIPDGNFSMGSNDGDEQPVHTVTLDAFWIDKTEVTNTMYDACVQAGICDLPNVVDDCGNTSYGSHPVVFVSWFDAKTYCEWVDARLPTEAEWEKAARGTDGRPYPWGNANPTSQVANYDSNIGDTSLVGKYPQGASPYGVLDMAGNVWEWVSDWYDENYYRTLLSDNPMGPTSGNYRVLRGGSWDNVDY